MIDDASASGAAELGARYAGLVRTVHLGATAMLHDMWVNPLQEGDSRGPGYDERLWALTGHAVALSALVSDVGHLDGDGLRRMLESVHASGMPPLELVGESARASIARDVPGVATAADADLSGDVSDFASKSPTQLGKVYADYAYWLVDAATKLDVLRERLVDGAGQGDVHELEDGRCVEFYDFDDFDEAEASYYFVAAYTQDLCAIASQWTQLDAAGVRAVSLGLLEASVKHVEGNVLDVGRLLQPLLRHPSG